MWLFHFLINRYRIERNNTNQQTNSAQYANNFFHNKPPYKSVVLG